MEASGITDFSILRGEPFNRLLLRLHLETPDYLFVGRRALFFAGITWLPLLILSSLQGAALGRPDTFGFLQDYSAYSRFLIAVPALILTESVVDRWTSFIVQSLIRNGIIPDSELQDFMSAVNRTLKLRGSVIAAIALVPAAYALSYLGISEQIITGINTWGFTSTDSSIQITPAGYWFFLVSNPILIFLVLRWIWLYFVWCLFLWYTSRLDLELTPTHPDLSGGIGFLTIGQLTFTTVAFAIVTVDFSITANRIVYGFISPPDLYVKTTIVLVIVLVILLGPLFFFSPRLLYTKRKGYLDYGLLGTQYTKAFDDKWIDGNNPEQETLLGSSDIQSLADLINSFEGVRRMRIVPIGISAVAGAAMSVLIPLGLLQVVTIPASVTIRSIYKFIVRFTGVG